MREYTLLVKGGLMAGLRKSKNNPNESGALVQADGVIKEAGELTAVDDLATFDISSLEDCSWPFPQMFQLRSWTIVCTPTKIYTYDGSALTLVYTAEEGSTWTVGDFYNYIIMTNGKELITLDPETGEWSKYLDCLIPYCLCLCDVNGQLFVGGPEVSISAGFLGE